MTTEDKIHEVKLAVLLMVAGIWLYSVYVIYFMEVPA